MNHIDLVGRLVRDPEIKNTTTGKAVANFTIAVDRRFKNQDGQKEADFIPIVAWGKTAEFISQYIAKGRQVSVSGRLQVRSYDAQDGTKRWVTEVIADEVNGIGGKNAKNDQGTPKTGENSLMDTVEALGPDFALMADDDDAPPF